MQCVDFTAIHKTSFIEDDQLETDVCSISSDMDATECHEIL
jgi:hypothetical protein